MAAYPAGTWVTQVGWNHNEPLQDLLLDVLVAKGVKGLLVELDFLFGTDAAIGTSSRVSRNSTGWNNWCFRLNRHSSWNWSCCLLTARLIAVLVAVVAARNDAEPLPSISQVSLSDCA